MNYEKLLICIIHYIFKPSYKNYKNLYKKSMYFYKLVFLLLTKVFITFLIFILN